MRVIGLTGGIACGKSNVSDALAALGAFIIDGDVISRELTAPGGAALVPLRAAFGDGIFAPDGTLDRKALGARVFADAQARETLDGLMQPLIHARILDLLAEAARTGAPVAVLDMPLLYEKGLEALCDRVWCVWLPRDEQRSRLMLRSGYTAEEADARIDSQLSADEKARRAQVVIDTRGTIEQTRALIPALYAEELALAQQKGAPHGDESDAAANAAR